MIKYIDINKAINQITSGYLISNVNTISDGNMPKIIKIMPDKLLTKLLEKDFRFLFKKM